MKGLTLKRLLIAVVAMFVVIAAGSSAVIWSRFRIIADAEVARGQSLDAMLALKDARFHVVQIQQFLTDVGATRDAGGYAEARANQVAAHAALDRLTRAAGDLTRTVGVVRERIDTVQTVGADMAAAYIRDGTDAGNAIMKRPGTGLDDAAAALAAELDRLTGDVQQRFDGASRAAQTSALEARHYVMATLAGLLAVLMVALGLIYWRVVPPLGRLRRAMEAIRDGVSADETLDGLDGDFRQLGRVFSETLARMAARREADAVLASQNARIVQALDKASSCVLVLDAGRRISFVNEALLAALREGTESLRAEAPDFDVAQLIGAQVERMLPGLAGTGANGQDEQAIGERTFRLIANPVVDARGEALGTVVEWRELTQQKVAQHQLEGMIYGAKKGHLDWRLEIDKFEAGFWQGLAHNINEMLDALVKPLDLAAQYVDDIAHGKMPPKITDKYAGHFAKLTGNLNRCIGAIEAMIDDATMLAAAGAAGELARRADEHRHAGAFRVIVEGVNQTLDAIATPVADTQRVVAAMAEGDLTQRVQVEARGDFAVLREAINGSLDKLAATVDEIRRAAGSMRSATSEIATGNQDLSVRTEAQAHGVERTNAGMQSLTQTLEKNTEQSVQADKLAQQAREQAVNGGQVVGAAVQAMKEINASSSRIADIIAVIDEIAFQTNLLALNAAVEAARAGDHGRGFAVVAGEVRNLAQRSATAAKEIKTLIQTSVQRVEDGSRLVNDSGGTLADIVDSIKRVSGIIEEVATASREQTGSLGQLNQAVHQIEEGTQQNAALVEEIAAASKSLEEQADKMVGLVDYFRTGDMAAPGRLTAARAA